MSQQVRVVVLGAGVAGMTAAHELSRAGFKVDVYERRDSVGGKARSFMATRDGGSEKLIPGAQPAEHGFRFFPPFYRHLFDTMRRIPSPNSQRRFSQIPSPVTGKGTVFANLTSTNDILIARSHNPAIRFPTRIWNPHSLRTWRIRIWDRHFLTDNILMTGPDLKILARRLRTLMGASRERRFAQYESMGWIDFIRGNSVPAEGQDGVAAGQSTKSGPEDLLECAVRSLSRSLVAAHADELSVRTGGYILLALEWPIFVWRNGHRPKVLNGPTNDAWLDPWRTDLEKEKVTFHLNCNVVRFNSNGNRIVGVQITENGTERTEVADWYICALPADVLREIPTVTSELARVDPQFGNLSNLTFRWMNGMMFYLRKDHPMIKGHVIYMDSKWALTSISQQQFWSSSLLRKATGGQVEGILSVDISDWETPGTDVRKAAKDCTREEVANEVLAQIRSHLSKTDYKHVVDARNIHSWFMDSDIRPPNLNNSGGFNLEPLLINAADSWQWRPRQQTLFDNLFLAGDYTRTYTDLATMEGANESARRAVNALLERVGSHEPRCQVWPMHGFPLTSLHMRRDRARLMKDLIEHYGNAEKAGAAYANAVHEIELLDADALTTLRTT